MTMQKGVRKFSGTGSFRAAGLALIISMFWLPVVLHHLSASRTNLESGISAAHDTSPLLPRLTPWASIGGCGAGGSGGTASNIRWIGKGVSGGLVDLQFLYSKNIGQNFLYDTYLTRLSGKFNWSTDWGITLPVVNKTGPLQPQTNVDEEAGHMVGGIGDMSFDYTKKFGLEGEYYLQLSLTVPTGQYNISRGKDNSKLFLPVSLQRGGGIYTSNFALNYTKDVEDGLWIFEAGYTWPFALNFHGKNQMVNGEADQYNSVDERWDLLDGEERDRFEYYFKPYGENDLGGFTPQSLNLVAYYGYKGQAGFVHSFGLTFSAPLGVAWIPEFSASSYDPTPDPDHKAWTGSLNYGMEISRKTLPIFLAISKTIQDQTNEPNSLDPYDDGPFSTWDQPDWNDLAQSWTFAVGVKASLF
ncbi:hypothetical protein ACFL5V_10235 [Fibrobacterota bacterium]